MRRQRKKRKRVSGFVMMSWELLNSPAYVGLRHSSAKLLPYFLGKPKINPADPAYYQIDFQFTYKEAERLGFSTSTFSRCLEELMEEGFVDPVWKGGLRGDGKSPNRFRLSRRWRLRGKDLPRVSWKRFAPSSFHV
jgi:hypothetical protein